jgi:hypothetical protein
MKLMQNKKWATVSVGLLLVASLLLGGCTNLTPVDPQPSPAPAPSPSPTPPPASQLPESKDVIVTYNYGDTDKVQLSANNIVLKIGQRLILQPASGLTKNTHFTSSGEYFFSDVMKPAPTVQDSGQAVFTAIKQGKGKLQIIPNTNETARAVDLWVTVQ